MSKSFVHPWLLILALLLGCDSNGVDVIGPENGNDEEKDVLTLSITGAPGTGLNLSELGWGGGIPGTDVTLHRVRDFEEIMRTSATSDSDGTARLEGPTGFQWVSAIRTLSSAEERVLPANADVPILAGGTKLNVAGETNGQLELHPARTGTIVISEVSLVQPPPWEMEGSNYPGSGYVELFNNADHTVYLDGMLIGRYYDYYRDYSHNNHHSCSATEPMRADPDGLWAAHIYRFPGSGGEHPVGPGETVLIAVSATDHRDVHPDLLDLSNADFEFRPVGVGSADNPAAPDLIDVGPEPFHHVMLRWMTWFVAEPLDVEGLQRMVDTGAGTGSGLDFARIPRESVLDAAFIWYDNADAFTPTGPNPICRDPVHPHFDAVPGGFLVSLEARFSAQRRAVRTRDGRTVLLDTNVSAVDFVRSERTPGWIPDPEEW